MNNTRNLFLCSVLVDHNTPQLPHFITMYWWINYLIVFWLIQFVFKMKICSSRSYDLPSTRRQPTCRQLAVNSFSCRQLIKFTWKIYKWGTGVLSLGETTYFSWLSVKIHSQKRLCVDKKKYQSLTSWAKTNQCEKARWRTTVLLFWDNFFTRKKLRFYSEIRPKTFANSLWADTLQFYAYFVDFKCILEELTAQVSWRRVDGK